jgi:hypothetical protein
VSTPAARPKATALLHDEKERQADPQTYMDLKAATASAAAGVSRKCGPRTRAEMTVLQIDGADGHGTPQLDEFNRPTGTLTPAWRYLVEQCELRGYELKVQCANSPEINDCDASAWLERTHLSLNAEKIPISKGASHSDAIDVAIWGLVKEATCLAEPRVYFNSRCRWRSTRVRSSGLRGGTLAKENHEGIRKTHGTGKRPAKRFKVAAEAA